MKYVRIIFDVTDLFVLQDFIRARYNIVRSRFVNTEINIVVVARISALILMVFNFVILWQVGTGTFVM
jgi:hypothetical protein